MKKKFFFLPLIAAMALTSCSSDDISGDEPQLPVNGDDAAYLAVNIVTPRSTGAMAAPSRANDFDSGIGDESTVYSALFILFDANGNQMLQQTPTFTSWTTPTDPTPAVEKISNAVLVLDGAKTWTDSQILAVLNYSGTISTSATLNEVLALVEDYKVTKKADKDVFVMSNSVYNNANGTVTALPIGAKIHKTSDDAKDDPVNIYVERVVAKVTTTKITNKTFTITPTTETVDGVNKTFIPEIKGIEVANVAEKSYLVKNIAGIDLTWAWNDPANFRSYWANIPTDLTYFNQSYNQITDKPTESAQTYYIQENTTDTQLNQTAVLVTAKLKDGEGNAVNNLIWFAGGYYSLDGYKNILANQLKMKYAVKTTTEGADIYESIPAESLETYQDASWEVWQVSPKLTTEAESASYVDVNTKAAVSVADINAFLAGQQFQARQWKDGMCYYYVYIKHNGSEENGDLLNGIVRNHIYSLTLTDLKGLGVPVFDPNKVIVPKRPTDEAFYLAAKVHINKWRIVSQSVSFE